MTHGIIFNRFALQLSQSKPYIKKLCFIEQKIAKIEEQKSLKNQSIYKQE